MTNTLHCQSSENFIRTPCQYALQIISEINIERKKEEEMTKRIQKKIYVC